MSRGFVNEDDQEDVPIVPPRAFLPEGTSNFVTPNGISELLAEKEMLIKGKDNLNSTSENEKRISLNYINAKLKLLNNRIAEAKVINHGDQPQDEIKFGASVTLLTESNGNIQTFQIVGVDEADISRGKVSFISPLARILINKKAGDRVTLKQAGKEITLEILSVTYNASR